MSAPGPRSISPFLTIISHDHAAFLHLLEAFETQVNVISNGKRPSFHVLTGVIAYFKNYSRQVHHPREELLLNMLRRRAPELSARVNKIIDDHRRLPDRLAVLEELLQTYQANGNAGERTFVRAAREFIIFEQLHIGEEDKNFIPAAIHHLSPADWEWADSSLADERDPLSGQAVIAPLTRIRENIFATDNQTHHTDH